MIVSCKNEPDLLKLAKLAISRNTFCLLPENFLISLLTFKNRECSNLAKEKILSLLKDNLVGILQNKLPDINFQISTSRYQLPCNKMGRFSRYMYLPPCIRGMSEEEFQSFEPPKFSINSQSVERTVKLTSEAYMKAYSLDVRHKIILSKEKLRKSRASFSSKKH